MQPTKLFSTNDFTREQLDRLFDPMFLDAEKNNVVCIRPNYQSNGQAFNIDIVVRTQLSHLSTQQLADKFKAVLDSIKNCKQVSFSTDGVEISLFPGHFDKDCDRLFETLKQSVDRAFSTIKEIFEIS